MIGFGKSDIGQTRTSNQDDFAILHLENDLTVAVVCDGMGGENAGDVASRLVCKRVKQELEERCKSNLSDEQMQDLLYNTLQKANSELYALASTHIEYQGMGTTAVVLITRGETAYVANVGDSRIYMLHHGALTQLTTDHSLVQALLERGEITKEQMQCHPQKNMITRAVGIGRILEVDFQVLHGLSDAIFLLCSDGLTSCCGDEQIKQVILNSKMDEICENLVEQANQAGGFDNITAVVVL